MVREGYKETEIGEIPVEWEVRELQSISDIEMGQSPSSITYNTEELGLPFLQGCADFGSNYPQPRTYCAEPIRVASPGSILISVRAPVGDLNVADATYCIGRGLASISPKSSTHPNYLYYLLKYAKNELEKYAVGSTFSAINSAVLHKYLLPLPPLPEQRRIAAVLSAIDEAIEKTEALIAKLRQVKAGLMQDLLTKGIDEEGRVRSEETHAFKDSEIGRVPVEWEVGNVSDHCCVILSNVDKKTHPKEIPVFLCNYLDVFNNDYITLDIRFMKASATTSEIQKYSISKNDVLITKDSETAEEIAITTAVLEDRGTVLCGYHLAIIRPKPDIFNGIFLSKSLNLAPIHRQFVRGAKGVTRYGLNKSEIENAIIPLPPLPEQHRIAAVLTAADDRIAREEAYRDKLLAMKKGLMADLLTGRVRVPESIGACAVRCEQPEGRV